MNSYIKVKNDEIEIVESLLINNDIEFETNTDPMVYVCEELVDSYIENNIEEELRPLFREAEKDMVEYIYEEANNALDGNFTIDTLSSFVIDKCEE